MSGKLIKRIGNSAGNKIAKLSRLSGEQILDIQHKREEYLTNLDALNPDDEVAIELTRRMLAANSIEIYNAYLPQIEELYLPIEKDIEYKNKPFDPEYNIRYINITKWVTDKEENSLEKLVNVYAVLANDDCNIALVFNRTEKKTNVYLAVVNTRNDKTNTKADDYKNRLISAIRGNFPGADWVGKDEEYEDDDELGKGIIPCLKNENNKHFSVASASNIPTEKSEKFVSQTIEKLLDGIIPKSKKEEYTLILLATPIKDVDRRKLRLGEFYSGLSPYESWTTDFHIMENKSQSSSATVGVNIGASAGVQNGQTSSITESDSTTDQESNTLSEQDSTTKNDGKATSDMKSGSEAQSENEVNTTSSTDNTSHTDNTSSTDSTAHTDSESDNVGGGASFIANVNYTHGITDSDTITNSITSGAADSSGHAETVAKAIGKSVQKTITEGVTNTVSKNVARTTGKTVANTLGRAVTTAMATTSGIAKSTSLGANFGANFARSSTVTAMIGSNEGLTRTFTNYNIRHALELLELQMKRLEQSTALGMWDFAAYVVSEEPKIANNVAHSYLALTLGEDSYMSKSAINLWRGNDSDKREQEITNNIFSFIRELRHPVFGLNPDYINLGELYLEHVGKEDEKEYEKYKEFLEYNEYPSLITATTSLSGKELAYSLNFPRKSISGLPVLECASFARNVVKYDGTNDVDKTVELGNVFHMNYEDKKNAVELSLKSLSSHTFITGSTGSGKSNTIYHILDKAQKNNVSFLVIEPAKGEYKHAYGNKKGVTVYGTNPSISTLLRLNPFSFPKEVHVLEHLDRLVEIFNVCWPMYAAMPAVLKDAVQKSYEDCGWDLLKSTNKYNENIYPEFADVAKNVLDIIELSEYDKENKGAYKGSLVTRLKSLTTGINALVFSNDELSNEDMFDKNVIVDLSRVGSSETKALIMGILVLKLQEYRMSSDIRMNSDLRHLTIMEEAHNLLRRTSIEQPTEGSNILGKSVEMISNAIAEMRTYGEGFIIADQAPGLMDMSVIRNTNTKIIMRLPDQGDRELVGKAANLNDDQITELSKLPCGVAAVYQNEWLQPILCKVGKFETGNETYTCPHNSVDVIFNRDKQLSDSLLNCIMDKELLRKGDKQDLRELKDLIIRSGLSTYIKVDFLDYLEATKTEGLKKLRKLIYDFLDAEDAIDKSKQYSDIYEWVDSVVEKLKPDIKNYSRKQINLVTALILYEKTVRDSSYGNLFSRFTGIYKNGGGVF